jgi:hypothetical protein
MLRTDDSAAHASNWRTVLAVDAGLGVSVILVGLVIAAAVNFVIGSGVLVAGACYVGLVGYRAYRWNRLRRQAQP